MIAVAIDPDEVAKAAVEAARRARVQDAPEQAVVDDLKDQLDEHERR